jgi:hypothetical protein
MYIMRSTTKDYCLLGCYTILPGRKLPEFYRRLPPTQKNKLHGKLWPLGGVESNTRENGDEEKKCLPDERR